MQRMQKARAARAGIMGSLGTAGKGKGMSLLDGALFAHKNMKKMRGLVQWMAWLANKGAVLCVGGCGRELLCVRPGEVGVPMERLCVCVCERGCEGEAR